MLSISQITYLNDYAARITDSGGIYHPNCLSDQVLAEEEISLDMEGEFDHYACDACTEIIGDEDVPCHTEGCMICLKRESKDKD